MRFFALEKTVSSKGPFNGGTYFLYLFWILKFRMTILYSEELFKIDFGLKIIDGEISFGFTFTSKIQ